MSLWDQWGQMNPQQQQMYMAQLLGLGRPQGQPPTGAAPQEGGGGLSESALYQTPTQQLDPTTQSMLQNYQAQQPIIQGLGQFQSVTGAPASSPYPMAGGYNGFGGTGTL